MKVFICQNCGHIEIGKAPEKCPVCSSPKDKYVQNDNIFKESREKSPEAEIKHVPALKVNTQCSLVPEEGCTDVYISIGKKIHPMEEKHFIMFVDSYLDDVYVERVMFTPKGVNPAACIHIKPKTQAQKFMAIINCNIHGYWYSEISLKEKE